jgi:hypothetical protein
MINNDTGVITAFRNSYTRSENLQRNKALRAELMRHYDVTALRGSYIENYGTPDAVEVGENVFFVVDSYGTGHLERDLRRLGERYEQDSILYVPKGAEEGYIIGTSKEAPWPGYGTREKLGHPVFGKSGEFMTKVRGRPFVLESANPVESEHVKDYPRGFMGEWGRSAVIKNAPKR